MIKQRAQFLDDAIATASPAKLLCLLYDRLQLDLSLAVAALGEGQRVDAAGHLGHAQQILLELRASLDVDAWEGGPGLASLYAFLLGELGRAMVSGDADVVTSCAEVVAPLRLAWHEAAGTPAASTAAA